MAEFFRRPLFRRGFGTYWRGSTSTVLPDNPILTEDDHPILDENSIVLWTET